MREQSGGRFTAMREKKKIGEQSGASPMGSWLSEWFITNTYIHT